MSPPAFGFSLTVGATGMLAGALDFVAEQSDHTLVVARHASHALPTVSVHAQARLMSIGGRRRRA